MSVNIFDFISRDSDQFIIECDRCPRDRKRRLERDSINMLLIAANYHGWRVIGSELHCRKCATEITMAAKYSNKFKEGE